MSEVDSNEFYLFDRIVKIQQIFYKYGEDNFYISYSGGKDSQVLSRLIDEAVPENEIPRVYCDTGIELNMIRDFVKSQAEKDERIKIIQPRVPIKPMLEQVGYPFKSKEHSLYVDVFQRLGWTKTTTKYVDDKKGRYKCPKTLLFQFSDENPLRISPKCCDKLKKEPLRKFSEESGKPYGIVGIRRGEGGRRNRAVCLAFKDKNGEKLSRFQPLVMATEEWEDWYIQKRNIEICDIYKPPYNFKRTGCKGCPFALELQTQLETLQEFFPNERRQCEIIWKPVYDEYRRLNYRLKDGCYTEQLCMEMVK